MAIYVEGLKELEKDFTRLTESSLVHVESASTELANKIRDRARTLAPVDTGSLKKGIRVSKPSKRRKRKYQISARVWFGKGAAHGVPVELGHNIVRNGKVIGRVQAKPFLRPAADEHTNATENEIVKAINKAIDSI